MAQGNLLSAEGSGGVGSVSPGSQTCQGYPQSPESRHPAVPVNSLPGYCPPGRPLRPVTDATTGNALLLSGPRPRPPFLSPPPPGLGPQAPDPRTRVAAVTDWGDPLAGHCLWPSPRAAPPTLGAADPKRIQKKGEITTASLGPPLAVGSAKHPCTPKASDPGEAAPHHDHGRKSQDIPCGLQGRPNLPAAGAGHTITLKLWGRGTEICREIPPKNSSW